MFRIQGGLNAVALEKKKMQSKIVIALLLAVGILAIGCKKDQALHFTEEQEKAWKTYVFPENSISVELPSAPVEMPVPVSNPNSDGFKLWQAGESDQKLLFFFGEIKRIAPLADVREFEEFVRFWMKNSAADRLPSNFSPQIEIEKLSELDYLGIIRAANGKQAIAMTSCMSLDEDLKTIRVVLSAVSNDGQSDYRNFRRAMKSAVFGGKTCDAAIDYGEEFLEDQKN